jgi:SpoVK/Ycf46/Vps4 family AAA+-type ATPase
MTKQEMYSRLCVTALPPIKNFAEHSFESRQEYVTKPNIYLPKIIMDSIYGHIDSFLRSGRTHTGIILYGPPGTGKTSLSNLIALKYNMDIFYAENRPTAHRNIRQTKVVANRSFQNGAYIMALEDFDLGLISGFGFDALGTLLSELEEKCERPVIYVLTTNNFNKIPAALLCPGRVDLRVNVPLMEDEECFCMLEDAFPGVTKDTKDRVKEAVKPHLPMAPCNIKMLLEFSVDQSKSVEENAHCFMKFFALRVDDEKKIYESRVTTQ